MSDVQLNILNYALLALIYLFFARVLWAVWSEVRGPRPGIQQPQAGNRRSGTPDATTPASRPAVPVATNVNRSRGSRGTPSRLTVLEPKVRKGSAYPIGTEITVGRGPQCSIGVPDDTFASQMHARVIRRDGSIWLEDLGSTNGTHINGARLGAPVQLVVGDRVQIGSTIFEAQ
jgi:pSer/pThr/pTyr-binding forkhead associated (FHA) protein